MELRNRANGAKKEVARCLDVGLGPTIYSGERYSKMSERIKRQHKKPTEVAEANAQQNDVPCPRPSFPPQGF
ncbi:hypothetical protein PsorP6_009242 [Peronosclerospora sorghi]|uniref:Uncharacterized protein n=1 Tax=Peronosclerospora sorghi TaxID=230839 RepID=A0ACC0W0H4_9STRA|nr:hypothetical protein PsorP6_009242 [Peronosclerospora sorghi]